MSALQPDGCHWRCTSHPGGTDHDRECPVALESRHRDRISVRRVAYCVSKEDRPELAHVHLSRGNLDGNGNEVYACATDGHRMCVARLPAFHGTVPVAVLPSAKTWTEPTGTTHQFPNWRRLIGPIVANRTWAFDADLQDMIMALRRFVDLFNVAYARSVGAWKERHAEKKKRADALAEELKAAKGRDSLKRDDVLLPRAPKADLKVLRAAVEEAEKNATDAWHARPERDVPSLVFVPELARSHFRLVLEAPSWLPHNDELLENDLHILDAGKMAMRVGSFQLPFGPKHAICVNADYLLATLEQHRRELKSSAGAKVTISGGNDPLAAIIIESNDGSPLQDVFDVIMPRKSSHVVPSKKKRKKR